MSTQLAIMVSIDEHTVSIQTLQDRSASVKLPVVCFDKNESTLSAADPPQVHLTTPLGLYNDQIRRVSISWLRGASGQHLS